ncbi:hypothetical protein UO65_0438 [Actinokineospora spheciospongiae]|uniref:Gram-positive cocci surface proteins LPxTG domain-containing protein n=1 Tax=Actinokineospora spheciospongiae TaxID=909613 RepID=W7IV38_9PSEU|nr:LPXTG cell wall anchor domain-containing protein [Actinokineospora spheciospongiae]EWC64233.1 hypothetical protein UO65_0438 [Actinokineospora spheciospongiae]PWW64730.1 LPXTG-motif cell wall-anchored protein [Actinokineospora spheciospongiae]
MSTSRSRVLARTAVIGIFASTAVFGLTGVASAHAGKVSASCDKETSTVTVNLHDYTQGSTNTWTLTDNGEELGKGSFGKGHQQTWDKQDATIKHEYVLTVKTSDDPTGEKKWSFTAKAEADACKKVVPPTTPPAETTTPPASTTTPPAETTAPPVTTTTSAAVSTSPAPAAAPAEDDLADTGASIALPLAIGGVLVLGGAGALIAVRRRASNN